MITSLQWYKEDACPLYLRLISPAAARVTETLGKRIIVNLQLCYLYNYSTQWRHRRSVSVLLYDLLQDLS